MAILLVMLLHLFSCSPNGDYSIEYRDVKHNGREYYKVRKSVTDYQTQLNIMATLSYYGIKSKILDGKVFLEEDMYKKDMNLMYNISIKARDEEWLRTHKRGKSGAPPQE